MERRRFLTGSMVSAAAASMGLGATAEIPVAAPREYYQVRKYHLQTGPQLKLTESYFETLVPALNRMGMGPVGAFRLDIGPETPTYYLVIPSTSVEALAMIDLALGKDAEFLKAADAFWSAPAAAPAFLRVESWLLAAFAGWPKLIAPAGAATKARRIVQMRTYESPTMADHVCKVEMFHSGEFEIFRNAGFHPVFFGDTLVGSQMPSLTYMLSFANMAELDAQWDVFRNDPAWKKLSASTRFGYEAIVSNVSNLVLSPLNVSQI